MARPVYRVKLISSANGDDVLVVQDRDGNRVEVRGRLDEDESDPLQAVIDALPGPLVGGELMAGNEASVSDRMYAGALPVLAALFDEACPRMPFKGRY